MRWLLFLSRLAFICNIFFLFSVLLRFKDFVGEESIASTIIIIGYFLAVFVFNPIINVLYLTIAVIRKKLFDVVPKWLVIANFIFLIFQAVFILFILNDTLHS